MRLLASLAIVGSLLVGCAKYHTADCHCGDPYGSRFEEPPLKLNGRR